MATAIPKTGLSSFCATAAVWLGTDCSIAEGIVTLFERCGGTDVLMVELMKQYRVNHISGGSVERVDFMPNGETVRHFGSPFAGAQQMSPEPKVRRNMAERR